MELAARVLENAHVRLEPLEERHRAEHREPHHEGQRAAVGEDLGPEEAQRQDRLGRAALDEHEDAEYGDAEAVKERARVAPGSLSEKARAIAVLMRELGYESSAPDLAEPTIEALNCVYHDLAQADPNVCALDLALIENLANADVEHRSCMARGDNACVFCLKAR